jgi:arginyl-tRNA synthetase
MIKISKNLKNPKKLKKFKKFPKNPKKSLISPFSKALSPLYFIKIKMKSLTSILRELISSAVSKSVPVSETPMVTPAASKFNMDFVCPVALTIYNKHKSSGCFGIPNQKDLAALIHSHISPHPIVSNIEVASNGFLNIYLNAEYLASQVTSVARGNLILDLQVAPIKVLVDFSSPNIAKEMHVGHLRSTIIGDSLCRCLEFLGHRVKRVNHLGDWGTQFGMLLCYLGDTYPDWQVNAPDISNLEVFYKAAKKAFDASEEFKDRARLRVVDLQSGEETAMKAWRYIFKVSREYLQIIYDRLDIVIEDFGESFYNPMLVPVRDELLEKGFISESEGALIFNVEGHKVPLMVQKKDGGFGYDSTDLAAAKYRMLEEQCDRVIYVTDSGQATHFYAIFDAAKAVGWHQPPRTRMDHAGFGVVLGPDGKKFKTREGTSIKLINLLNEAKDRAREQLEKREKEAGVGNRTHLTPEQFEHAAEVLGIAAIKYFDLKQNRISTYAFSFDKMLDPKGNTAVYLIYAYARICSILEKISQEDLDNALAGTCLLVDPSERALALYLCRLPDILETVVEEMALNKLCDLLYEISVKFSDFYTKCRVIGSESQASRVQLCLATKEVMRKIFNLIGIKPIEKI